MRDRYSEEFSVHQVSVLSPLLLITVLEALSREFCTGCPCELLNADNLMTISEYLWKLLLKIEHPSQG